MKITKTQLKQMILEELGDALHEEQESLGGELDYEERELMEEYNMIQNKIRSIQDHLLRARLQSKDLYDLLQESDERLGYDHRHSGQAAMLMTKTGQALRLIKKLDDAP